MFIEQIVGTALGFILMFGYIGYRKVAGYAFFVDIVLGALSMWMFLGTYSGMIVGLLSSLLITVFLQLYRKLYGYEKLELIRKNGRLLPALYWTRYEPEWSVRRRP
jgi:hypothetical protein